ncbi:hypothetical protein A3Q56_03009 [Intoshia linei]|uniref:IBB domain-containing protein n=1 Tax=Intoshia linei TaxID=1819745 RepID=A0A177B6H4_9BILA|nr:hypothetical protein A3Q56_03009 [Intoshia linei]
MSKKSKKRRRQKKRNNRLDSSSNNSTSRSRSRSNDHEDSEKHGEAYTLNMERLRSVKRNHQIRQKELANQKSGQQLNVRNQCNFFDFTAHDN